MGYSHTNVWEILFANFKLKTATRGHSWCRTGTKINRCWGIHSRNIYVKFCWNRTSTFPDNHQKPSSLKLLPGGSPAVEAVRKPTSVRTSTQEMFAWNFIKIRQVLSEIIIGNHVRNFWTKLPPGGTPVVRPVRKSTGIGIFTQGTSVRYFVEIQPALSEIIIGNQVRNFWTKIATRGRPCCQTGPKINWWRDIHSRNVYLKFCWNLTSTFRDNHQKLSSQLLV